MSAISSSGPGGAGCGRPPRPRSTGGSARTVDLAVGVERDGRHRDEDARDQLARAATGRSARPGPARRRRGRPPGGVRPAPVDSTVTTASRTPGCATSTALTSPGSTRCPRIFTWSSTRPSRSSCPSAASGPGRRCGTAAPAVRVERIGHEPVGGQVRPAGVAPGEAGAAEVDVADHAHRHRSQVGVEDVGAHPGQRPADRRDVAAQRPGDRVPADGHRRLGRPVLVEQHAARRERVPAVADLPGQRLAAQHQQRGQGRRLLRAELAGQQVEVAGGQLDEAERAGVGQPSGPARPARRRAAAATAAAR